MPTVTFSVGRNALNENFINMGSFTVGPNAGNVSWFYGPGSYHGISSYGNGAGGTDLRFSGNTFVGLDDSRGEGADNDYNDLTVQITSGNAIFTGGQLYVYYDPVTIYNFYASPNPQNSTGGTPQYSTTLYWSSVNGTSATITSSAGESWGVGTSGNRGIFNLPQSTAGSNSPRSRSYSLTVSNPNSSKSASASVLVRNDNTPSNGWTTSFTNLNPSTLYTLTIGTLSGVDMPTTISTTSGNFVGNGGSFSGSRNFTNGQVVQLRTTSLAFNTSMSGVASNATYGNTNTKTVTVSYPGGSKSITITTKAPVVKETFNYADNVGKFPYEDIDLVTNTPLEFTTSAKITADDIEIAQEVKLDKPDAQVSINNGAWQNVRQI
tara:strand:+ start:1639 stop:2775 length:1137 start_codon:yes stop_codon:yes gene_type:complete